MQRQHGQGCMVLDRRGVVRRGGERDGHGNGRGEAGSRAGVPHGPAPTTRSSRLCPGLPADARLHSDRGSRLVVVGAVRACRFAAMESTSSLLDQRAAILGRHGPPVREGRGAPGEQPIANPNKRAHVRSRAHGKTSITQSHSHACVELFVFGKGGAVQLWTRRRSAIGGVKLVSATVEALMMLCGGVRGREGWQALRVVQTDWADGELHKRLSPAQKANQRQGETRP